MTTTMPKKTYYDLKREKGEKVAYIFNHHDYERKKQNTREGTDKDCVDLEICFKNMGFIVKCYSNYTKKQINEQVSKMKEEIKVSCIIVAVMTHGNENHVLWAYDETYSANDLIIHPLVSSKSLAGVPKFFLFQACRGKNTDTGHEVEADGGSQKKEEEVIVKDADYICMFSSVEDHLSWRDPNDGAVLIQILRKTLTSCWEYLDLVKILTRVNYIIANEFKKSYKGEYVHGMPEIRSTLRKFLCFNNN